MWLNIDMERRERSGEEDMKTLHTENGVTTEIEWCNHFFCLSSARAYSRGRAVARVTYSGRTLSVCADDMKPLMDMIHNQGLEHTVETI